MKKAIGSTTLSRAESVYHTPNLDYLFVYQPIPGMGTAVPAHARELSLSNLTSCCGSTWTYTYNELGLPVTIRERWDGVTPTYDPHYTIYYKKK